MLERWYNPDTIKYTRPEVIWLLGHFPEIKHGEWPAYPKGTAYYREAHLSKKAIDYEASSEKIISIAKELGSRLIMAGYDGALVLLYYSAGLSYETISKMTGITEKIIIGKVDNVLSYVEGEKRKGSIYPGK